MTKQDNFSEGLKIPVVSGQTYPVIGGPIQPGTMLVFTGTIQDEKNQWVINLLVKNGDNVSFLVMKFHAESQLASIFSQFQEFWNWIFAPFRDLARLVYSFVICHRNSLVAVLHGMSPTIFYNLCAEPNVPI
jgi:hypothetical protein